MLGFRMFVSAAVFTCAHHVHAGPLVTPGTGQASSVRQIAMSTQPPSSTAHIDPIQGAGFVAGGGFTSFGSIATNYARGSAGHTAEFFFAGFPNPGPIDYIRFRGNAGAQAILQSTGLVTAGSGTSDTIASFIATESVLYSITGHIRISDAQGAGPGAGLTSAGVRLSRTTNPIQTLVNETLSTFEPGTLILDFTGTLQPGSYSLRGFSSAFADAFAPGASWVADTDYDIRMDFYQIPAPGALAATPLFVLAMARRRRRD